MLPMTGDTKPVPWLVTQFNEGGASFSPDMRWVAYLSNGSGRAELYVRPFTPTGSGSSTAAGKWRVSKDGALGIPKWRADSKEIIFRAADESMMAVEISESGSAFQAGMPKRLFAAQPTNGPLLDKSGKIRQGTTSQMRTEGIGTGNVFCKREKKIGNVSG
jgi:Tol biopolymer transport system component